MIHSYEESVEYLTSHGWRKTSSGAYVKNGHELVFDTSHYVELYGSDGVWLSESRIDSVQDLVRFIQVNRLC